MIPDNLFISTRGDGCMFRCSECGSVHIVRASDVCFGSCSICTSSICL